MQVGLRTSDLGQPLNNSNGDAETEGGEATAQDHRAWQWPNQVFECPKQASFCCAPMPIPQVGTELANCCSHVDPRVLGSRVAQGKRSGMSRQSPLPEVCPPSSSP